MVCVSLPFPFLCPRQTPLADHAVLSCCSQTQHGSECAVEAALVRAMKPLSSPGSRLSLSPSWSQSFGSHHVSLFPSRTSQNLFIVHKCYVFLVFMVVILPSMGLTRYLTPDLPPLSQAHPRVGTSSFRYCRPTCGCCKSIPQMTVQCLS